MLPDGRPCSLKGRMVLGVIQLGRGHQTILVHLWRDLFNLDLLVLSGCERDLENLSTPLHDSWSKHTRKRLDKLLWKKLRHLSETCCGVALRQSWDAVNAVFEYQQRRTEWLQMVVVVFFSQTSLHWQARRFHVINKRVKSRREHAKWCFSVGDSCRIVLRHFGLNRWQRRNHSQMVSEIKSKSGHDMALSWENKLLLLKWSVGYSCLSSIFVNKKKQEPRCRKGCTGRLLLIQVWVDTQVVLVKPTSHQVIVEWPSGHNERTLGVRGGYQDLLAVKIPNHRRKCWMQLFQHRVIESLHGEVQLVAGASQKMNLGRQTF